MWRKWQLLEVKNCQWKPLPILQYSIHAMHDWTPRLSSMWLITSSKVQSVLLTNVLCNSCHGNKIGEHAFNCCLQSCDGSPSFIPIEGIELGAIHVTKFTRWSTGITFDLSTFICTIPFQTHSPQNLHWCNLPDCLVCLVSLWCGHLWSVVCMHVCGGREWATQHHW